MPSDIPQAGNPYPIANQTRVGFLKNHITRPNIEVGDYTYYDDPLGMQEFERNVLYHFDFIGDRLIIGKFCSIATGVKFIMNGGNHRTDWLTNYPFPVFGGDWAAAMPESWPNKGDTVIGNDVWIGANTFIGSGVTIGDGAVIGANDGTFDAAGYHLAVAMILRRVIDDLVDQQRPVLHLPQHLRPAPPHWPLS